MSGIVISQFPRKLEYDYKLDFLKGCAILFVIFIHSIPISLQYSAYTFFYFGQAVPIFFLISGRLGYMLWETRDKKEVWMGSFRRIFKKIIIPLLFIIFLEGLYLLMSQNYSIYSLLKDFVVSGGWGPGSYFPWVYLQLIIILPLLNIFCNSRLSDMTKILSVFMISLLLEFISFKLMVPEWLYRLLFFRYLFVFYLGIWWGKRGELKISYTLIFLAILSFFYIYADRYVGNVLSPLVYPAWQGSHAPAYFWSIVLVLILFKLANLDFLLKKTISKLGKASYHIFLIQMVYFLILGSFITNIIDIYGNSIVLLIIIVNAITCSFLGYLFYRLRNRLNLVISHI